jgi:hypothetical protein
VRRSVRRSGFSATALLIIAFFSAVLLGGVQEMSCAMHGLGAAPRAAGETHSAAHHAADASQPTHQRGHHEHGRGEHGCDCSCIGACTAVAPLMMPPVVATLRVALIDPEPRRPLDLEPAHAPPAEPDRLLPFANGPPAAALI